MLKSRTILLLLLSTAVLLSCTTYTELVRSAYPKISSLSEESNYDRLSNSSFNSFSVYRANLAGDFGLSYFWSYSYHYYFSYTVGSYSFDVDILSSLLYPGESLIQMGNPFPEYYRETQTGVTLDLYLLSQETVLSKKLYLEMSIDRSVMSSRGVHRSAGSRGPVSLMIRNRRDQLLFASSEGSDSFVQFEVVDIHDGILYGRYSARLGSPDNQTAYYDIFDGEIWIRL